MTGPIDAGGRRRGLAAWPTALRRVLPQLTLCACQAAHPDDGAGAITIRPPIELGAFECTDTGAFRIADDDGQACLELFRAASYHPPHRSPLGIALVNGVVAGDFVFEVDARQTGPEYPHRDLVFVFGWRDADHFCYAHLASEADDNAHHVQVVDGADRTPVTTWRTAGVAWGSRWHDIRVERRGTAVTVRFDGREVLRGEVPAWRGRLGVGSFDDTARFRALQITAGAGG
jgi:hypothetical protein